MREYEAETYCARTAFAGLVRRLRPASASTARRPSMELLAAISRDDAQYVSAELDRGFAVNYCNNMGVTVRLAHGPSR